MAPREGWKLASYKLPEDLIETLKAEAEKRGTSQTALIIQGLQYVLGIASDTAINTTESVLGIDKRIETAIAPIRLELSEIKAEIEGIRARSVEISSAKLPAPKPQKVPSENALQGVSKKSSVRSIAQTRAVEGEKPPSGRVKQKNYGLIPPNASEGLNQTEICDFYGLSWRNLKRNCDIAGFSDVTDYFAEMTGIQWKPSPLVGRSKRYAPIC